ncbi:phosphoenolpyruvate synthase [Desulfuromonas versatilis]|uniref:Phosphoenolpyruvate synthase n=1 Tax=Desulfuromonas versatilis TaxID=2802975 RepID=A0ABM9SDC5_9BACT|nr:phosphoenolpyruvate synthase [Desulfuromonas versatilis]BCR02983.1 phosphoenolpyruvate synthase [Desulfuromonas versatilis]
MTKPSESIRWFEQLSNRDVPLVGGKNASLGEMIGALKAEGIRVPDGFATTAAAFRHFLEANRLEERIREHLAAFQRGAKSLHATGEAIRRLIRRGDWPEEIAAAIGAAYRELGRRCGAEELDVAVRSSATAEDLPDASFAGQQETFLNIGGEPELLEACRRCYASLFTDRAIAYRENQGFDHLQVALSVGVQKMVRADKAGAGVMFSIDTETGFPRVVVIDAAWGLGENVVQGAVSPDSYTVFKPLLAEPALSPILRKKLGGKEKKLVYARSAGQTTRNAETSARERNSFVLGDEEILQLARWAVIIEAHYGRPMDMEWAKDGETGELFIVQARPETVQSRKQAGVLKSYSLKQQGELLLSGLAIGEGIAAGRVQVIKSASEIERFEPGSILVTGMTDPDWVPIMKKAAGIVTDHGGRTSHAAIVSRELGIAAVIGTERGTSELKDGQEVTLSCAEGEQGRIYAGLLEFEQSEVNLEELPEIRTRIMLNIASPAAAFRWWRLPCRGIGLARMEFIINNLIQAHPMALLNYDQLEDKEARRRIRELTRHYPDKSEYFVDQLAQGIATIAASQYPEPVIVRMSDFKTNEYAELIGGRQFEFAEENPMLGFRGASRYYSERYRAGFALECAAIKRVREKIGLANLVVMIPFCRTLKEADRVLEVLAEEGLVRGRNGLEIYVMVEIPANVVLAEQFAERFDGFSIGSNDLTQLTLGVDRDSALLRELFDERDPAVKSLIRQAIRAANQTGTKIGICGQAPSDYPDFAAFLVEEGIDSISLNPDSVIGVIRRVAEVER